MLGTTYENSQSATVSLQSPQCLGPLITDQTIPSEGALPLWSRNTQTHRLLSWEDLQNG